MAYAILDTNIYIDHWERGAHSQELDLIRKSFLVRHSAVVLSELRRGAHTSAARRIVESLRRLAPSTWAPTEADWWRAGELVAKVGAARGWEVGKKRDFQNDALIGLTALRHGATLVTGNRDDFELLAREIPLKIWVL